MYVCLVAELVHKETSNNGYCLLNPVTTEAVYVLSVLMILLAVSGQLLFNR